MSGDSITDLLKPRGEVSQVEHVEQASEIEESPDTHVTFSHGRVGTRPQMMIAFRRSTGETDVFPYSILRGVRTTDPSLGFTLTFGETAVHVRGSQLTRLFRYVCEQRVSEVVEADRETLLRGAECAVSEVVVEGRGPKQSWRQGGVTKK